MEVTTILHLEPGTQLQGTAGRMRWAGTVNLNGTAFATCPVELAGGTLNGKVEEGVIEGRWEGSGLLEWTGGEMNGGLLLLTGRGAGHRQSARWLGHQASSGPGSCSTTREA
jgi:hypothetical protein